jgi:hypothetical protein
MANRVQFLICVFVLIARAALVAGTNDAVVLARGQPLAWIRTSADKTHFVGDGTDHSFVPWGFNYDHDDAGRFLEYYWADDWAKVTNDFREMKILGANVVRVSPQLCCLMKSPEQPDETNLARLGMLVRLAEENGLYLDVTGLGCYHKDEVPAWYDAMDESARWKVQARYWRAVAEVCKDSPAIFCYDLMNEPVPSGDRKGDWLPGQPLDGSYFVQRLTTDMRGRTEKEVAKEWIAEMSAAIRAVDKRHMITVGLACWEVPFGPGARSAFCDPDVSAGLDFLSVHYYPRQGKLADDLAILKHYDIGKPLVIEEIFPLSADVETTEEFIRRSRMDADGWISFYWGKTPDEYDKEPGIRASAVGGWLRHFCALREEMLGGNFSPTPRTQSPPGAKDIAEAKVDPAVYNSLVGRYDYDKKRLTVTRVGNQLFAQFAGRNCEIFPKSETEYFWKVMDAQVTFVKDDRGKVTKTIYHRDGQTIILTKIVLELFWLSRYGRWFGAAALLYAFCIGIGVSIRDRVPFQIMREFFHSLPRNFAGCFKGWNIAWHFGAIGLGVVLVTSGFDWFYLCATRSPQLLAWMIPGINLGVWVPLALPPSLLLAGMAFKKAPIVRTGWALAQVALIGFVLTELIKAVTGRPQPPWFVGPDTSHVFHFGLLRSEIVSGWPSGHTIIAFAMSVTLFWLFPQKKWLGAASLLYAFYVGLSISMTVHWFADFASGIIFGIVVGTTVGRSFAAMDFPSRGNGVQSAFDRIDVHWWEFWK